MSMKYPNDPIGKRTRDLTACSAVPQPIAPPRVPLKRDATVDSVWYVRTLKKLKQRIGRFQSNRKVSLGHNLHQSPFSTLRLTSFWPPEGCTPSIWFADYDDLKHGEREELQCFGKVLHERRSASQAKVEEIVLVVKETLWKINFNFIKEQCMYVN
jgi:hypothetical protein